MKNVFALLLTISAAVISVVAQQPANVQTHSLRGTIKDLNGAVINGLTLISEGKRGNSAVTDINGEFAIDLEVGDHEIGISPKSLYDLRLFIRITKNGPNPDNVNLTVDPSKVCCNSASNIPFPKPTSLPKPPFPPVARAVRARGEVIVVVKIDVEGGVVSAIAENGHPLLRAASVAAAKGSRFEASRDQNEKERTARITYVFLQDEDKLRPGNVRYKNILRVDVVNLYNIIQGF